MQVNKHLKLPYTGGSISDSKIDVYVSYYQQKDQQFVTLSRSEYL